MSFTRLFASFSLSAAMLFSVASMAAAATLNVAGGQLLGASGVNVGGNFYDVAFLQGTCIALFDGCDSAADFTFPSSAQASLASQALLDQVFSDGGSGLFDSDPTATLGCSFALNCRAWTPVSVTGTNLAARAAWNDSNEANDVIQGGILSPDNTFIGSTVNVWAVWTPVPEPSTALLVAMGLAGLGWRRRDRQS